ncbi:olfactory receptor 1L4-like [Hemicordylus capensis]|uniref:olfactory receptor 1L4-like n=1 Tax=Hemicordylus capensis TaxID=884348 RepID=UPI0023022ABB|nr:olfactory receptor 1L4-like [Hemicordylus capensis]
MKHGNSSGTSELFLRGFPTHPEFQGLLFPLFLSMYLLTLLGNVTIILLIRIDVQLLQAPMYFFLSHLALADLGFTSSIVPKVLVNLLSQEKTISYHGCLTQMYFYMCFGNSDSFLLAAMAYDRYVAICCPLSYSVRMSCKRCLLLATVSWIIPIIHSLVYTLLMSRISFCDSEEIPHFFCDIYPLLDIACSDTSAIGMLLLTEGVVEVLGPFVLIVVSYAYIFYTIMKIPSDTGKRKAFSTCGSHLAVVVLFYGTVSWVYFKPHSKNSGHKDTVAAVMYTMVTPMLNPFIYSLRNSEMKAALKRVIRQRFQ